MLLVVQTVGVGKVGTGTTQPSGFLVHHFSESLVAAGNILGKDRTGISAFLIMLALDMSEEDAIEEYLLSNKLLEGFVREFYKGHPVAPDLREYSDSVLCVTRENIQTSIDAIKAKYETYQEFLEKEYGIDAEKRAALKAIYCEG